MSQLTPHFSLAELCRSETASRKGIDNTCPDVLLPNMLKVAETLEVIRKHYGKPITVLSCYRSPAVNKAVGGSKTSAHCSASAVDFRISGVSNIEICKVVPTLVQYDQVIYEFGEDGWVHLGLGGKQRKQLLSAVKQNGKTVYLAGIQEAA